MGSETEPAKLLLPYLQRADELQKHEPLVAYYCRLYAMERGLKIPQKERTKTTNALLVSLMNQLEKDLGPTESFPTSQLGGDTSSRHGEKDLGRSESFPPSYPGADFSSQHVDMANLHSSTNEPTQPSSYSSPNYPSSNFHEPPSASTPDISAYPQHYHQPYSEQHSLPQSYHPPENTSYLNFQSYPSFQDTSFPTAPTHQPSYYHNPDVTYSSPSVPPPTNYVSTLV